MATSKGVDCYGFIGDGCANYSIEFTVRKDSFTVNRAATWEKRGFEVSVEAGWDGISIVGRFAFKVRDPGGAEISTEWNNINSLTGNLDGGTMTDLQNQRTVQAGDIMISYGFYDAGSGVAGLTNRDICYVAITRTQNSWMGRIVPSGSPQENKPFHRFVLPAPHDVGMNTMQNADLILQSPMASAFVFLLPAPLPLTAVLEHALENGYASTVFYGLSITQKDSMRVMLNLGARYFEFRPARMPPVIEAGVSSLEDKPYFMHMCIPGLAYDTFLDEVLQFLADNPTEHVVVHLRGDGVIEACPIPSQQEKQQILDKALSKHSDISWGSLEEYRNKSVKELRESRKRLIVIDGAKQYSSYGNEYNTLTPDPIVDALQKMNKEEQLHGKDSGGLTLMQCQATATGVIEALLWSVLSSNLSTSILMSTKASCDYRTHQVVWDRVSNPENLSFDEPMVVMNDFFDGATAELSVGLSKKRFEA